MMTKFNQELYARIKAKKNEPLTEKISSTPAPDEGRAASPGVSLKEITPHVKKRKTKDKGKEKVGASVWADVGTALAWTNEVVTLEELKEILSMPSHEMVSRHVYKLVQVIFFHFLLSSSISITYLS